MWHQGGCVCRARGAMPLLVLRHGKQGVKRGLMGLQKLQLKTVIITLFCDHTIPWVCYRRRNQWLRLALALFCLPLIWFSRVVYLLVGVAEGWGGRRGYACPCAVLGHAMLRYSVGVGLGVMRVRVSGLCFIALLARRAFKD